MARIFIDVHPDGTFATGTCHGDPVAHAAEQDIGVVTYMSDDVDTDLDAPFGKHFKHHSIGQGLGFGPVGRWTGDWRKWGAFCINKWGAWFERVEGHARRMRIPSKTEQLDARITACLSASEWLGIGVIKNRFRKVQTSTLFDRLATLEKAGIIIEDRYRHPINNLETARYRLCAAE